MANKVIGFTLDIEGIDTLDKLKNEIKATKEELAQLEKGSEEYNATAKKLAKLQAEQKAVRKEQTELTKAMLETRQATKPYDALSAKLNRLRKDYKNLAAAGQGQTTQAKELLAQVAALDEELKSIDASVGQYQRNVGNYAGGIKEAFGDFASGLGELGAIVNPAALGVGAVISGAQALGAEVLRLEKQFSDLGKAASQATGLTGAALDELVVNTQALATTFEQETSELIGAQNTLIKEFGISAAEAFEVVQTGLSSSANAGGDFLESVKQYSTQIREAGGNASQLVSILAKAGQEGIYSDKGIDAVKEFGLLLKSEGGKAKETLAETFGPEFANQIFEGLNSGALTTIDVLQKVGGKINEVGDDAQRQKLVETLFGSAGIDAGSRFLATLGDIDSELKNITDTTNPYIAAQNKLLQANKELAAAQKAVADEFSGANSGIATFTARAKAFSLKVFLAAFKALLAALAPVKELVVSIGQQFADVAQRLGLFSKQADETGGGLQVFFNRMTKYFLMPLRTAAVLIKGAIDIFFAISGAVLDLAQKIPFVSEAFEYLAGLYVNFIDSFSQFPALAAGIIEAIKQVGREFIRFFELAVLDAQIFAAKAKGIFSDAAAAQVKVLQSQRKALADESRNLAQAFAKGFREQQEKDLAAEAATQKKAAQEAETAKQKAIAERQAQGQAARIAARKKEVEAQKAFAKEELDFYKTQAAVLDKLLARNEALRIGQIRDSQSQQRALAKQASESRQEAAKMELEELKTLQAERLKQTAAVYGQGSSKYKEVLEENAKALAEGEAALANTLLRERQNLTDQLLKIDADYQKEQEKAQAAQLQSRLAQLEKAAKLQTLETQAAAAEGVIKEEDAASQILEIQRRLLEEKIALYQKDLEAKEKLAAAGYDVDKSALADIRLAIATAKKDLAELGQAGESEAGKNAEKSISDIIEKYKTKTEEASQILFDFFTLQQNRLRSQVDSQAEANQLERQQLEESLESASGLERRYLEQKLEANTKTAEKIAAERERIERRQAAAEKARAITQSIINTAVAVTKVIANPLQAIITGAAGAVQTAIIAAQKFAGGGLVKGQNIKRQPNGDNVLATVKTGEVILNEAQQRAIGGPRVFAAAGVPGFASGGLVGPTIPASLPAANSGQITANSSELIEAINSRIDRFEVVYTANTQEAQDKAQKDRAEIELDASF